MMTTIDLSSISKLFQSFTTHCHLCKGQQLHALLLKCGHLQSLFPSNSLLQFYSRCSSQPIEAHKLFDSMSVRNPFSYNTLVDSYLYSNDITTSMALFSSNPQKNSYSWASMISALLKCCDLVSARRLFDEMPVKDVTTLNSLIHGYLRNSQPSEAFLLYREVNLDDKFILATIVSGCADHHVYGLGKQIHARIIVRGVELDSVLRSSLVNMYGKCEDLDSACGVLGSIACPDEFSLSALVSGYSNCGRTLDARRIFHKKRNPGVVLWNSMIDGYVLNDQAEEAFDLFLEMRREEEVLVNNSTFSIVLSACARFFAFETGKQIHVCGLKYGALEEVVVRSALVDSYAKCGQWKDACRAFSEVKVPDTVLLNSMISIYSNCGRIDEAISIFKSIPNRSLISWNSMLVGYSKNAHLDEALDLFTEMHRRNLRLDKVALASMISAAAHVCALGLGEQLFALATIVGLESDPIIVTSLIDLFCKSGNVANGRRLFCSSIKSDVAIWNAMMMGYASNGYGTEVLKFIEAMRSADILPNEISFIAVLSGCCHSGLVEEGMRWFYRMKDEYSIVPRLEHYSLVVDMLVRSGRLEDAIKFIDIMPFEADESMLTCVLGGCKAHGDEHLGSKVAERLMKLDPRNSGPFLQLSSLYAAHGKWDRSERIRALMRDRSIRKYPGYSWINN